MLVGTEYALGHCTLMLIREIRGHQFFTHPKMTFLATYSVVQPLTIKISFKNSFREIHYIYSLCLHLFIHHSFILLLKWHSALNLMCSHVYKNKIYHLLKNKYKNMATRQSFFFRARQLKSQDLCLIEKSELEYN